MIGGWLGRGLLGSGGSVAVELALTLPFLILIVMGVADFGTFLNQAQSLAAATRIGAEYARDSVTCNAGIQVLPPPPTISSACVTGISNAITISTLVNTATVTIPTPTLVCQCESTGVPATYHVCAGTNNFDLCFANPPTGFTGPSRYFITVSASQPFTPLFTWSGGPGLPGLALLPNTVSAVTELRWK